MPTVRSLIQHLNNLYKPDDVVAYAIWGTDDVRQQATETGRSVTDKQAEEVLEDVHRHHDATLGITWDSIDAALDELPRRKTRLPRIPRHNSPPGMGVTR